MKARARHILFLCRCLSPIAGPDNTKPILEEIRRGQVSWELLASLSGLHLVSPTLQHSLRAKRLADQVPEDFMQFLDVVYEANLERNRALRAQTESTIRLLNAGGVEPVLLKGASRLIEGKDQDLGARMMADIDLLVHPDDVETAHEAFLSEGYSPQFPEIDYTGAHHLAPLIHPNECAPVELHTQLYSNADPAWLSTEELWNGARLVKDHGLACRLLSPHHEPAYNVFHSEVHHRRFAKRLLGLRDLLDFSKDVRKGGENIDWTFVRKTFSEHGLNDVLDAYLYKAYALYGVSTPDVEKAGRPARRHFKRSLAGKYWEELTKTEKTMRNIRILFSEERIRSRFGCSSRWSDLAWHRLVYGTHLVRKFVIGGRRSILVGLMSGNDEERSELMADYDGTRLGS